MYPIKVSTSDASGGAVTSNMVALDTFATQFQTTIGCAVTGTVNYTVQYTLDNVLADGYLPSSGTWYNLTALASKTGTLSSYVDFPVTAVKLVQNTGNGSVEMTVLQTGAGD
jgi:hypothetical protein